MTTLTERLLAKAQQYENKAAALRLAAEELGGEDVARAKERMNGHLSKAMALRAEQRGRPVKRYQNGQGRREAVRALLAKGEPITARQAAAHLGVGGSYAQKLLADAGAVSVGRGHNVQWQLPHGKGAAPTPAAKPESAIPRAPRGRVRMKTSEMHAAILAVVKGASEPVSIDLLVRALRSHGYKMSRSQIVKHARGMTGLRREGSGPSMRYSLA